ncbi:hypothetical protein [Streptomyces sp. KLOTTS4A1]|uniref:hypothetical protein n=1 Tax=Streptomyces sp. KLOTTS4A1 TaxID=3390996 RepID=UPI0039F593F7
MLSISNADKAWKGMTKSFPAPEAPSRHAAPGEAERTAYAVLLHGPAARPGGADASQWLLLRDRTAKSPRTPSSQSCTADDPGPRSNG